MTVVSFVEFGWSALLFLIVLLYLPARPALPPSLTAATERTSFKKGLLRLFRYILNLIIQNV